MDVLFSIKPQFVDKILSGEKIFEYRKRGLADLTQVEWAFIYSCSPRKRIEAAFPLTQVLVDTPEKIWKQTCSFSGLSEIEFNRYYEGCGRAFAFVVKNLRVFDIPVNPRQIDEKFRPPQSFCFLKAGILYEELRNLVR